MLLLNNKQYLNVYKVGILLNANKMGRKTKINILEGIALGAGLLGGVVLLNALGEGNSEIMNHPYLQGLFVTAGAGAISTLYREGRAKNKDNKY